MQTFVEATGLYKIVTEGPAPSLNTLERLRLWLTEFRRFKKWSEWDARTAQFRSKQDALAHYCQIAKEIGAFPSEDELNLIRSSACGTITKGQSKMTGPVDDSYADPSHEDIFEAVKRNDEVTVSKYIAEDNDPNIRTREGLALLHFAADADAREVGLLLMKSCRIELDPQDDHGQSPLHFALMSGHKEFGQMLLDHHANSLIQDHDGNTAYDLLTPNQGQ